MKKSISLYKVILIITILFTGCKNKEEAEKVQSYNPYKEISQVISNQQAWEYFDLAQKSSANGDFESAFSYLEKSLEYEKSPIIYNELGIYANAVHDYPSAEKYFTLGKKLDATYWPIYINQSMTYILSNEDKKGEYLLKEMIKNCNSDYWISFANLHLAVIYSKDPQNCTKARECLKLTKKIKEDMEISDKVQKLEQKIIRNCRLK